MPTLIRLNPPDGYRPYGANVNYAPSGEVVDGQPVHWFAQCGWGPGGFGNYVFRQVGTRKAEIRDYKATRDVMDGRGDLIVGDDGKLYVTGQESDSDKLPEAWEVPGYVPIPDAVVDLSAVGDEAVRLLLERITKLEARVAQLQGATVDMNPVYKRIDETRAVADKANERGLNALTQLSKLPPPGISRDEAWQLAKDSVFADLNADSGIRTRVKALALEVLVGAIDYASAAAPGSTGSRLRVLIEKVVKGR